MKTFPARVTYRNAAAGLPPIDTTVPADRSIPLLATSAARLLFRSTDECTFALTQGDSRGSATLEAITSDACAIIGPFRGGPNVPKSLSRVFGLKLSDLLAHLGAATDPDDYVIHIEYQDTPRKPVAPRRKMTDEDRAEAMREYEEKLRVYEKEKAAYEAKPRVRTIRFPVDPADWRLEELEAFIGKVYDVLPPPSAESQSFHWFKARITGENWNGPGRRDKHPGYKVVISGMGFAATVRLPAFPTDALADWLEARNFELDLEMSEATAKRAALKSRLDASHERRAR